MNPFQYLKVLDHHAYFLHSIENAYEKLKTFLKDTFHISHTQNPDFFYEKFEVLGIDESRKIKLIHLSKSFKEGNKRIFIIEASGMTHEAQNSLLKIFEEPHIDTHFFIIMPSAEVLLPTLRSRILILNQQDQTSSLLTEAETFLKMSKKDRIEYVDELAKNISDDKATKNDAQEFLASLELVIYKKSGANNKKGLEAIIKARDYLNDRSPSTKQLLEYVALLI